MTARREFRAWYAWYRTEDKWERAASWGAPYPKGGAAKPRTPADYRDNAAHWARRHAARRAVEYSYRVEGTLTARRLLDYYDRLPVMPVRAPLGSMICQDLIPNGYRKSRI